MLTSRRFENPSQGKCNLILNNSDKTARVILEFEKDTFGVFYEEDAAEERCGPILQPKTRFFVNKKVKYVWDTQTLQFNRLKYVNIKIFVLLFVATTKLL